MIFRNMFMADLNLYFICHELGIFITIFWLKYRNKIMAENIIKMSRKVLCYFSGAALEQCPLH